MNATKEATKEPSNAVVAVISEDERISLGESGARPTPMPTKPVKPSSYFTKDRESKSKDTIEHLHNQRKILKSNHREVLGGIKTLQHGQEDILDNQEDILQNQDDILQNQELHQAWERQQFKALREDNKRLLDLVAQRLVLDPNDDSLPTNLETPSIPTGLPGPPSASSNVNTAPAVASPEPVTETAPAKVAAAEAAPVAIAPALTAPTGVDPLGEGAKSEASVGVEAKDNGGDITTVTTESNPTAERSVGLVGPGASPTPPPSTATGDRDDVQPRNETSKKTASACSGTQFPSSSTAGPSLKSSGTSNGEDEGGEDGDQTAEAKAPEASSDGGASGTELTSVSSMAPGSDGANTRKAIDGSNVSKTMQTKNSKAKSSAANTNKVRAAAVTDKATGSKSRNSTSSARPTTSQSKSKSKNKTKRQVSSGKATTQEHPVLRPGSTNTSSTAKNNSGSRSFGTKPRIAPRETKAVALLKKANKQRVAEQKAKDEVKEMLKKREQQRKQKEMKGHVEQKWCPNM